jgi:hypothetical protein
MRLLASRRSIIEASSMMTTSALERVLVIAAEAHLRWIELEQAVDGLRFAAGDLGQSLGGTAGRTGERNAQAHREEELDHRPEGRCLAGARPTGQNQHPPGRGLEDAGTAARSSSSR